MFDRVSQAAEKLATNVSRREFMGGLGKGALALAGAMGAMLAFPRLVQAGQQDFYFCSCRYAQDVTAAVVCTYGCPDGSTMTTGTDSNCTCYPIVNFQKHHGTWSVCGLLGSQCGPPP
jgi:hypothetical protein